MATTRTRGIPSGAVQYDGWAPGGLAEHGLEEKLAWWRRELVIILTIPGVTSNGTYGDVQLPEELPSSETVQFFMRVLTHQFEAVERYEGGEYWGTDEEDVPTWYQLPTGVLSAPQETLLSWACPILSSYGAGYYVYDLRKNRAYPEDWNGGDWGSGSSQYRSMMDRLFDRLHINHTIVETTSGFGAGVFRKASVNGGAEVATGYTRDFLPLTTCFSTWGSDFASTDGQLQVVGTAISGFEKMAQKLTGSGKATVAGLVVGGLASPATSFAFPLDWRQAGTDGLFCSRLWLPGLHIGKGKKTLGDKLERLFEKLDASKLEDFVDSGWYEALDVTNVAGVFARTFLTKLESAGITVYYEDVDWDDVVEMLPTLLAMVETLKEYIETANDEDAAASATIYYLLCALAQVQQLIELFLSLEFDYVVVLGMTDGFLEDQLGMDTEELAAFIAVMVPWVWESDSGTEPYYPPTVVLGSPLQAHSSAFNEFQPDEPELLDEGIPEPDPFNLPTFLAAEVGGYAYEIWRIWYQMALPTLDAARVFDIAGLVAMQLVNVDDLQFALLREEDGTGRLAKAIKAVISSYTDNTVDSLGFTPGEVVGYLVRQLLTDLFVEYFVRHEGADRETLYLLFSWMDTPDKQDRIEAALGEVVEIPLPRALRLFIRQEGWRYLSGRTAFETLPSTVWVRRCMTPDLSNDQAVGTWVNYFLFKDTDQEPDDIAMALAIVRLQLWTGDARDSDQAAVGGRPYYEATYANWVEEVRQGVRQWQRTATLQSPLAAFEGAVDMSAMLTRFNDWSLDIRAILDLPDAALSPVSRAIRKAYTQAEDEQSVTRTRR